MDALKQVFDSLSRTERRYLKSYLTAFHSRGHNRALELVELMEAEPDLSFADIAERMYGDPRSKAFLMLKARVMEKVLETLSLSVNFQNNPTYQEDPSYFEQIEARKEMLHATLLRRRGLEDVAVELIKKTIDRAHALGLPDLALQGYVLLRNVSNSPEEVRSELNPAIDAAFEAYRTDLLGVGMMDALRMVQREQQVYNQVQINFLTQNITLLQERLGAHYSLRGHYYALYLEVMLYEGQEELAKAKATLNELIELLNANKGLSSRNRLGVPYAQLAVIEIITGNFAAARDAAEHARTCFPPERLNYLKATIALIFACIYDGDLPTAAAAVADLDRFKTRERMSNSLAWVRYLDSCISFCQGDFKSAMDGLGDMQELFSHKEVWNSGLRLYEIQILIERGHLDLASARIEALRKHLQRHDTEERIERITRYLIHLERQSFSFQQPTADMEEMERKLASPGDWKSMRPEIIRFDVWVRARRADRPFYPVLCETLAQEAPFST